MANKMAAVLVLCLALIALAEQLPKAEADIYASCFDACQRSCKGGGQGRTFCEMKCDSDCFNEDIKSRLHIRAP